MPSIIYNDDVEMYDPSYYSGTNFDTNTSDQSTPETDPSINPYPVSDGTSRTGDGWIQDLTPSGGSGGTVYPNNPPTEKNPLSYSTKTIKEKTRIVIHDYTSAYLQSLYGQGFKFYAVYTDGTEDEVVYTEIFNPHTIDTDIVINEAEEIAHAVNQHFWEDTNGVHVTDEVQEDWKDAVEDSFSDLSNNKPYHNILINSLGMLLRSALYNLVSLSRSGLTIFDGLGNDISNVLASFTSAGASFREGGKTRATVTTQGLTVYDDTGSVSNGTETLGAQVAYIGIDESGKPFSRIGKSTKSYIEIGVNSNDNGYIDFYHYEVAQRLLLAHIGYATGTNASGGTSYAPYYDFGRRNSNTTIGNYSFIEGVYTTASSYASHAEGVHTTASSNASHAEGYYTTASGGSSHAEGDSTTASYGPSHAEGYFSEATGYSSHAEGYASEATGIYSHAEGNQSKASAECSHAEGYKTTASGLYSHAEGGNTTASGEYSHASGFHTNATANYQFVCGKYNHAVSSALFLIGNGTYNSGTNAFTVLSSGSSYFSGTASSNGTAITSDARIKTLIDELTPETSIKFLKQLKPKHYYKEGVEEYGFYAQEVETIPEFGDVLVSKDNTGVYDLEDYRLLNYQGMLAPMVSALQNALDRIEHLEQENAELKQQNKEFNERLDYIEKMIKF